MKTLTRPSDDQGWRKLASSIVKANLQLAGMNYVDLSAALAKIGVDAPPKNISSKLVRGSFSAVFFMQAMSVIGVERIDLPVHGNRD